jgi:hypothetical protein
MTAVPKLNGGGTYSAGFKDNATGDENRDRTLLCERALKDIRQSQV